MINCKPVRILFAAAFCFAGISQSARGAIVEVGDLNIINDPGNPSDGLRFLDVSFSVGLSREAALASAQSLYPDARLATVSEWDDIFDAAGVVFDTAFGPASNILTDTGTNNSMFITSFGNTVGQETLMNQLGVTRIGAGGDLLQTWWWSPAEQPNGSAWDLIKIVVWPGVIEEVSVSHVNNTNVSTIDVNSGHLIVTGVPEPSSLGFLSLGGLLAVRRRRR